MLANRFCLNRTCINYFCVNCFCIKCFRYGFFYPFRNRHAGYSRNPPDAALRIAFDRQLPNLLQARGGSYSLETAFTGRGRVLLAAANVEEEAWEAAGHGLLTAALIEALRAAPAAVNVAGLLVDVTSRVRAEAQQLGSIQTPKWVGDFEGGFTMPPLRAGAHYYRAFPEQTGLHVSADLRELAGFGLPEAILMRCAELFPTGLNDLQLAAVNEYRVLDGQSLLIVAPTSSGKTFIGKLAAVKAALGIQRAVFLVPYKALANEKYEQFAAHFTLLF